MKYRIHSEVDSRVFVVRDKGPIFLSIKREWVYLINDEIYFNSERNAIRTLIATEGKVEYTRPITS